MTLILYFHKIITKLNTHSKSSELMYKLSLLLKVNAFHKSFNAINTQFNDNSVVVKSNKFGKVFLIEYSGFQIFITCFDTKLLSFYISFLKDFSFNFGFISITIL